MSAILVAKRHRFAGHPITVENPAGSIRRPEWPPLTAHYGYFVGTRNVDGDDVDVFIRDRRGFAAFDHWNGTAYVIEQLKADGTRDEWKVMLGWNCVDEAVSAYLSNYGPDWAQRVGDVRAYGEDGLRQWLRSGDAQSLTKEFTSPASGTSGLAGYSLEGQRGARLAGRRKRRDGAKLRVINLTDYHGGAR